MEKNIQNTTKPETQKDTKSRSNGFTVASNVKSGNQICHECLEYACDNGMTACQAHDLCHPICIQ